MTADPTAPPCPALTVGSFGDLVRLDWDPVADPESGIFRYQVYRDGLPLGRTVAATTQFDDAGFEIGATHDYQVRALNGAWNESDACPAVSYSTTAGDANGDGAYGVADIFYLINFFFADGPPPQGNADANGDDAVSVTDVFYMINDLFADGPPAGPARAGAWRRSVVSRCVGGGGRGGETPGLDAAGKSRLVVGRGERGARAHGADPDRPLRSPRARRSVRSGRSANGSRRSRCGALRALRRRLGARGRARGRAGGGDAELPVPSVGAGVGGADRHLRRGRGDALRAGLVEPEPAARRVRRGADRRRGAARRQLRSASRSRHDGLSNDGGTLFESVENGWFG